MQHPTFCRICPVLCGLLVTTDGEQVVEVRGDPDHPITRGYSCPKGRAAGAFHHHPHRLDRPRVHDAPASWDDALGDLAARLSSIVDAHGPDAVAVYFGTWSWMDAHGRGRAEALLKHLGTRSRYSAITVDAIARLTVAELVGGFAGLLPAIDPDATGLTVLVGTNPVVSHGHAGAMVDPIRVLRRLAAGPGLWVLDPRRTETARLANRHLALRPGADPAVLAALVRALLDDGADHAYVAARTNPADVEGLRLAVAPWTPERAAARAGLEVAAIEELIAAVRLAGRVTVVTGTGATMAPEANLTEWLAWAVQILTGSFEHPKGAWFNPGAFLRLDRAPVAAAPADGRPGPGAPSRPELPSRFGERPCAALADEIEAGQVRALLVLGGDPLTSLPDSTRLRDAFARLEVLAVADVLEAETVAAATHVLAVAGQLERADVNWYTDRFGSSICAQRTDAVLTPGADRRTLHDVLDDLGARLGLAPDPQGLDRAVERVPRLADERVVVADPARVRGWVHEHVLPDGRWRVAPAPLVAQLADLSAADDTGAAVLAIPRRVARRMNSALRDVDRGGEDRAVWIHPGTDPSLADGDLVEVRRGGASIHAPVRVTTDIVVGAVSLPHGLADQNVNELTLARRGDVDPLTGMITQSGFPVTLVRVQAENAGITS